MPHRHLPLLSPAGHNAAATGPYYLYGSKATKIFDALGALGSIAFAYNIVIIPEVQVRSTSSAAGSKAARMNNLPLVLSGSASPCEAAVQATIRAPAVRNMYRSICIQYMFAVTLWMSITFIPYWCALHYLTPSAAPNPTSAGLVADRRFSFAGHMATACIPMC